MRRLIRFLVTPLLFVTSIGLVATPYIDWATTAGVEFRSIEVSSNGIGDTFEISFWNRSNSPPQLEVTQKSCGCLEVAPEQAEVNQRDLVAFRLPVARTGDSAKRVALVFSTKKQDVKIDFSYIYKEDLVIVEPPFCRYFNNF